MRRPLPVLAILAAVALAGCGTATPRTSPAPSSPPPSAASGVVPTGTPRDVVTGLAAPWSVLRLSDGTVLVSERDSGRIQRVVDDGLETVDTVPGVAAGGEGGLLGLAALETDETIWVYAYLTAVDDNRIVRMTYEEAPGAPILGPPEVVLAGIAKAGNHNGGRIAFGPDGMLYATTGDAAQPGLAQDPASLNGKILRMTPDGEAPDDNPVPGSLVYSLGHRNPQGIAWDAEGRLWAAEFGQSTWDELNLIDPGANYGWPVVEGRAGDPGYVDPVAQWTTDEASPSGLAFVDGTLFLAALRGQRLWAIDVDTADAATATPYLVGEVGRLRDVLAGPDGTLWVLTNNTDGRGSARDGDDRILELDLEPAP